MALLKDIPIKFPSVSSSEFGKKPENGFPFNSQQSFHRALRTDRKKAEIVEVPTIKYFDMEVRVDPALGEDETVLMTLADGAVTMSKIAMSSTLADEKLEPLTVEKLSKDMAAFADLMMAKSLGLQLPSYQKVLLDKLDDPGAYIKPIHPQFYTHMLPGPKEIIHGSIRMSPPTIHATADELSIHGSVKLISSDRTQAGIFSKKNAIDLRNAGWVDVPDNACEACYGVVGNEPCWHCDGTGEDPTL